MVNNDTTKNTCFSTPHAAGKIKLNPQVNERRSYRISCVAVGQPCRQDSEKWHHNDRDIKTSDCEESTIDLSNWPLVDASPVNDPMSGPDLAIECDATSKDTMDLWTIMEVATPPVPSPHKLGHTKQSASCDSPTSFHRYFQSPRAAPHIPEQSGDREVNHQNSHSFSQRFVGQAAQDQTGFPLPAGTNIKRFRSFNDRHGRTNGQWSSSNFHPKSTALRASMNKALPDPLSRGPELILEIPGLHHPPELDALLYDLRMANAAQCTTALFSTEYA